jgi:hypothetical protein
MGFGGCTLHFPKSVYLSTVTPDNPGKNFQELLARNFHVKRSLLFMKINFSLNTLSASLMLLISFAFRPVSVQAQCCSYTLSMHDGYGDGWNGGHLEIFKNGTSLGIFYGTGWGSTATIPFCTGDSIKFVYTPSMYENENTYELYTSDYNLVFEDGPNPIVGQAFVIAGDCNSTPIPGNNPCTAIPMDTVTCALGDNTTLIGSGINPGCAEFKGNDMWFTMKVPPSGNVSFETDSGSINDTGLAAWIGNTCADFHEIACDDDAGPESFSLLTLYNLDPNQTLFIQVFGYGGGLGSFRLCARDLGTVKLDSSELPIVTIHTMGQNIVPDNKIDAVMEIRYNGAGQINHVTDEPTEYNGHIGIEVRGASSSGYPQQPYGLETRLSDGTNNSVALLGMPEESDWVLLSNYNDRSLVRNLLADRLFSDMGEYSPRARLCEVLIDSTYKGIYLFGEKVKRDKNRVDISKLEPNDNSGDQLTGGYILQQNYWDPSTSFQSNYSPIDHPGFDVHFVYEYPKPAEISGLQKEYIASYVDSLETALYSPDFADPEMGYRKYLDVNSFIHYFLVNELSRNNDGFKKSVFMYKDRYSKGGKMKAGPIWDFDWAWKNIWGCFTSEKIDGSEWAHHVNDCPTDNYGHGWYIRFLQDSSFTQQLRCTYEDYRKTIFDTTYIFHYIDSVGAFVQNATLRHFKKWPILGISGPAPEVLAIATTYPAELDTLKSWIVKRLNWLDANIPGLCDNMTAVADPSDHQPALQYFPNPTDGIIHFEGNLKAKLPAQLILYDVTGRAIDSRLIESSSVSFDFELKEKGIYFFTLSNADGQVQYGKLVRM